MDTNAVVRVHRLTKFYGQRRGVEDISFVVQPGEVVGLLGPNGSGKTTVIRMLVGLISISSGHAEILGQNVSTSSPDIRTHLGYLPGTLGLYEHLTARQFFTLLGNLRRKNCDSTISELSERLSLDLDLRIKTMSKGTKQKVGLLQAFMHEPSLLILDEPTSGLDPLVQHEFEHLLGKYQDRGGSVILSSHVLSEVEKLAHRVIILNNGRLLANEKVETLPGHESRDVVIHFDRVVDPQHFANVEGFQLISASQTQIVGITTGSQRPLLEIALPLGLVRIESPEPSLDELFRHLVTNNRSAVSLNGDNR